MIARWYVHTISVETFQGTGAYGDVFNAPVSVKGFLSGSRKLVRDGSGQQVVAESSFYTEPTNAALFTPDSRVTADNAVSRVIAVSVNDTGGLMPNVEHVAVALT